MQIVVKGNSCEIREMFGRCLVVGAIYNTLGGAYRMVEWSRCSGHLQGTMNYEITLESVPEFKSQEVLAAEDAVRKAKESLLAAEDTLKKIKEK